MAVPHSCRSLLSNCSKDPVCSAGTRLHTLDYVENAIQDYSQGMRRHRVYDNLFQGSLYTCRLRKR